MNVFKIDGLPFTFCRLPLGTILEHENGERWVKIYFEGAPMWMNTMTHIRRIKGFWISLIKMCGA